MVPVTCYKTKKQTLVLKVMSLLFLLVAVSSQAQTPIVWLPTASDSLLSVSSNVDKDLKARVQTALYHYGVLSRQKPRCRLVKIKLYNTAFRPYAIAFLYSNALLTFHSVRIDFDSQYRVVKILRHYHLQPQDFIHTGQQNSTCSNPKIKAMLFLPAYQNTVGYTACSSPAKESFDNQQYCRMLSNFKQHYQPGEYVALLGSAATVSNFDQYASCPHLQFFMSLSGEDEDHDNNLPAGVAFWAYDPTVVTGNTDPIITSDHFNLEASPSLQTAVVGACHLFSNDVSKGMCPVLLNSSRLQGLQQFSSGTTSLDIPGAEATYACFSQRYLSTGNFLQSMKQCAKSYDPLIKNNDSHKMYIVNHTNSPILVNGGSLLADDTMQVETTGKGEVNIKDKAGHACLMAKGTQSEYDIQNLDQGYFEVYDSNSASKTVSRCQIDNLVFALPFPERPFGKGSGVIFGTYASKSASPTKCMPVKTQFSYQLDDASQGQCDSSALHFSLQGQFVGQVYAPITQAAQKQGVSPAAVSFGDITFNGSFGSSIALGSPGYYYVGLWDFKLTGVQGLPTGCQLTFFNNVPIYNDTTGTDIDLLLEKSTTH